MAKQTLHTKVLTFLRTEKTKRDALQALIVECVEHAQKHDNGFDHLSTLVSGLISLKSRNCNAIREYILDCCVNGISWQKSKSGVYMYKVTGDVTYKEIGYPWYAHKANAATNTNKEVSASAILAYLKGLQTKMEKNGVKDGEQDKLMAFLNTSKEMLA